LGGSDVVFYFQKKTTSEPLPKTVETVPIRFELPAQTDCTLLKHRFAPLKWSINRFQPVIYVTTGNLTRRNWQT